MTAFTNQTSAKPTRRRVLAGSAATLGVLTAARAAPAAAEAEAVRPFRVDIPQAALTDLRQRIAMTRWPGKETVSDASQGAPLADLRPLVEYWGSGYDWRKAEAGLNALPQFKTRIDGLDIHFIHVRSRHANALPLVMTHGWPGSVFELLETVGPLTDPTAHGGRAEDAFHLVLPSLPGYGFSDKPTGPGWGPDRIAQAWTVLMGRLGYSRFVAQGGDWGAAVTLEMARQAKPGLLGVHLNLTPALPPEVAGALGSGVAPAGLSGRELTTFTDLAAFGKKGGFAYNAMMSARPQTMGYGVTDSPAFLAAWLLVHPGFTGWAYGSDLSQSLTRDQVLDDITLYWLTDSAASAGRIYWENRRGSLVSAGAWRTDEIRLPVAVTNFGEDFYAPPEAWVRRAYSNLIYFNEVERGGHFAAWEQPALFSREIRSAFRSLRRPA